MKHNNTSLMFQSGKCLQITVYLWVVPLRGARRPHNRPLHKYVGKPAGHELRILTKNSETSQQPHTVVHEISLVGAQRSHLSRYYLGALTLSMHSGKYIDCACRCVQCPCTSNYFRCVIHVRHASFIHVLSIFPIFKQNVERG